MGDAADDLRYKEEVFRDEEAERDRAMQKRLDQDGDLDRFVQQAQRDQAQRDAEPTIVDNLMVQNFLTCPAKFYWMHQKHYRSLDVAPPLAFGLAIHEAVEVFRQELQFGKVSREEAERRALVHFEKIYTDEPCDEKRNMTSGLGLLEAYFKQCENEDLETLATEVGGLMMLSKEENIMYAGRIDVVGLLNGRLVVMDVKTTTMTIHEFIDQQDLSNQLTGYIWIASETMGRAIEEGVFDVMAIKKRTKKGVISYEYEFARPYFDRTDMDIERFKKNTLHVVRMIKMCEQDDVWPMNPGACRLFFQDCVYKRLCKAHGMQAIEGSWKVEKWEPYKEEK